MRDWVPYSFLDVNRVKALKRALLDPNASVSKLARQYGISPKQAYRIRDGKSWGWVQPDLPPQEVVEANEVSRKLAKGFTFVAVLPDSKVVVARPPFPPEPVVKVSVKPKQSKEADAASLPS